MDLVLRFQQEQICWSLEIKEKRELKQGGVHICYSTADEHTYLLFSPKVHVWIDPNVESL